MNVCNRGIQIFHSVNSVLFADLIASSSFASGDKGKQAREKISTLLRVSEKKININGMKHRTPATKAHRKRTQKGV